MATQQQAASPIVAGPRPLQFTQQLPHRQPMTSLDLSADDVPKDGTSPEEAPPAYTPPIRTRLQENLAVALLANNPALAQRLRTMPLPTPMATLRADSPDPDEEPFEELSPIYLRVSTRVDVTKDNNIFALNFTPAEQANSIADAIVKAFKSGSVAEGGLPMLDQDGRPRPVKIEVDAGITVEGSNNVVGSEMAVVDIMRARYGAPRKRMASESVAGASAGLSEGSQPGSRRRSATVEMEELPAKRQRGE